VLDLNGRLHISGFAISEERVVIGVRGQAILLYSNIDGSKISEISVDTNIYSMIDYNTDYFIIGGIEANIKLIHKEEFKVYKTFKMAVMVEE
jgi:hypothetical protein